MSDIGLLPAGLDAESAICWCEAAEVRLRTWVKGIGAVTRTSAICLGSVTRKSLNTRAQSLIHDTHQSGPHLRFSVPNSRGSCLCSCPVQGHARSSATRAFRLRKPQRSARHLTLTTSPALQTGLFRHRRPTTGTYQQRDRGRIHELHRTRLVRPANPTRYAIPGVWPTCCREQRQN